ncbi:MAG: c-type cytochrome [Planctomycetota bacterium]|nr:c-type cytochrome [Planctomycetota bacterium]
MTDNVAVFEGELLINAAGRWRFALRVDGGDGTLVVHDGDGLARLTQSTSGAGRTLTEWLDLEPGYLRLSIIFKRRGVARVRLRTLWEYGGPAGESFALEPIPSRAVRVPHELQADVEAGLAARHGRVLLGRKGCVRCHLPGGAAALHLASKAGPDLSNVGVRLGADWMRRWIAEPAALLPGANMPTLLKEEEAEELDDLVAYLESLTGQVDAGGSTQVDESTLATEDAVTDRGRALYHSIGCVACHGSLESAAVVFDDHYLAEGLTEELADEPPPVPFGDLRGKWRPASLAQFLLDPQALRPAGSMPSMNLSEGEADDLTHYLLGLWGAAPRSSGGNEAGADSIERGAKLFRALNCGACHTLAEQAETRPAPPLAELVQGDCAGLVSADGAQYDLTDEEVRAIAAGLAELRVATDQAAPLDLAERQLENGHCLACHALDGQGGPPDTERIFFRANDERTDLGDEGRLPPDLSGVGFRLTTSWLRSLLLAGERSRPYMATRMPSYRPQALENLAENLGRRGGLWPDADLAFPIPDDAAVLAGRRLMDTQDGLACESCHVHGNRPPSGSPGLAMTAFAERLRYEWYRAYMPNPARFKPGTRMPSFATDGVSAETDILGGDMNAQMEAMWAYFSLGEFSPPPQDSMAQHGMALTVGSRPRVIRSFLREAGSRGIAVGFPVGLHLAFDAKACRLAELWRGDFVNASGSWAGRGGSTLGGQGESLWTPPSALFELPEHVEPEFLGYSLDAGGVPSFIYRLGALTVEDRMEPRIGSEPGLLRELTLSALPEGVVLHCAGNGAVLVDVQASGASLSPVAGQAGVYRLTATEAAAALAAPIVIRLELSL